MYVKPDFHFPMCVQKEPVRNDNPLTCTLSMGKCV